MRAPRGAGASRGSDRVEAARSPWRSRTTRIRDRWRVSAPLQDSESALSEVHLLCIAKSADSESCREVPFVPDSLQHLQRTPSPRRRGGENGAVRRRDRAPMRSPVNSDGSPPLHCAPRIVIPNPHLATDFRLRASRSATRKAATSRPRPLSARAAMDGSPCSTWRTGSLRSSGDGWVSE